MRKLLIVVVQLSTILCQPKNRDGNPDIFKDKVQRPPKSLSESVEALDKDSVLKDFIGEKLLIAVKGVRKAEIKYYSENKDAWKKSYSQILR